MSIDVAATVNGEWPDWTEFDDDGEDFDLSFLGVEMREPTILEMMLLFRFFCMYGNKSITGPGRKIINALGGTDLPDDSLAYLLWMQVRDDD